MPDIALRFNKDMLVLSAPIDTNLKKQGVEIEKDREFINLIEPEAVKDAYAIEQLAGAQCLVTNTNGITQARLTHINMEDRDTELATAALTVVNALKPQHVLAEIGSTFLPLDASSAASLNQNRDQYARAAQAFGEGGFDAFFLHGMDNSVDMKCALMGVRKESNAPVFAVLDIDKKLNASKESPSFDSVQLHDELSMMREYGADVVGFSTAAPFERVLALVEGLEQDFHAPLLLEFKVGEVVSRQLVATEKNPYCTPDVMFDYALQLRAAGVQFLRAGGNATSAYTAALAAATQGTDVVVAFDEEGGQ